MIWRSLRRVELPRDATLGEGREKAGSTKAIGQLIGTKQRDVLLSKLKIDSSKRDPGRSTSRIGRFQANVRDRFGNGLRLALFCPLLTLLHGFPVPIPAQFSRSCVWHDAARRVWHKTSIRCARTQQANLGIVFRLIDYLYFPSVGVE